MPSDDHSPISAKDAKHLFADWKSAPAIVLAVSGGPDSIALMWLAALDRTADESARGSRPKPGQPRLRQSLAGALVSLAGGRIRIEPAPPRRYRTG